MRKFRSSLGWGGFRKRCLYDSTERECRRYIRAWWLQDAHFSGYMSGLYRRERRLWWGTSSEVTETGAGGPASPSTPVGTRFKEFYPEGDEFGGGQIGYNLQRGGSVYGVEADIRSQHQGFGGCYIR